MNQTPDGGTHSAGDESGGGADVEASTRGREYAERLQAKQHVWWKRALDVQRPYRYNLRRYRLGRTLDVGCGIGRLLGTLEAGSIGVDHNPHAVALARRAGLPADTVEQFRASPHARPRAFDSMLLAHIVEHLERDEAAAVIRSYLPYVRPGGSVLFICPQERGYRSDPTHVRFYDGEDLGQLARDLGLHPGRWSSFPLPRLLGQVFIYNEINLPATLPSR